MDCVAMYALFTTASSWQLSVEWDICTNRFGTACSFVHLCTIHFSFAKRMAITMISDGLESLLRNDNDDDNHILVKCSALLEVQNRLFLQDDEGCMNKEHHSGYSMGSSSAQLSAKVGRVQRNCVLEQQSEFTWLIQQTLVQTRYVLGIALYCKDMYTHA
jgi:hypothetical protein